MYCTAREQQLRRENLQGPPWSITAAPSRVQNNLQLVADILVPVALNELIYLGKPSVKKCTEAMDNFVAFGGVFPPIKGRFKNKQYNNQKNNVIWKQQNTLQSIQRCMGGGVEKLRTLSKSSLCFPTGLSVIFCPLFCCPLIIALSANRASWNRARGDLESQMSKTCPTT